ncbi:hypothetical protein [Sporosarcina sp. FSL K6-1508]|uniref:hypothetical protein n=1 Tax=Sporosarcina sp. FSL K6-1508 TaxID=2921553 RepID=UPI0030F5A255
MDALNEVVNGNWVEISGLIFIISIIYSAVHIIYDIITKTDIEKSLTYRGRDRIISSFLIFILFVLVTSVVTAEQLVEMKDENGLFFSILLVIVVSLFFTIICIFVLFIIHFIFTLTKFYPKYEVRINDEKEEYWRILKVTKSGGVILKKKELYLTLPDVNDLDNKIIRVQSNSEN